MWGDLLSDFARQEPNWMSPLDTSYQLTMDSVYLGQQKSFDTIRMSRSLLASQFSSLVDVPEREGVGELGGGGDWPFLPHQPENNGNSLLLPRAKLIVPTHSYGTRPRVRRSQFEVSHFQHQNLQRHRRHHPQNAPAPNEHKHAERARRHNIYSRNAQIDTCNTHDLDMNTQNNGSWEYPWELLYY